MVESAQEILESVYRLNPAVAIEDFGDAALALHCIDLQLVELNATAQDLVARLDGRSTLGGVAAAMAEEYDQSTETIEADAAEIACQLLKFNIIEQVNSLSDDPNGSQRPTTM